MNKGVDFNSDFSSTHYRDHLANEVKEEYQDHKVVTDVMELMDIEENLVLL